MVQMQSLLQNISNISEVQDISSYSLFPLFLPKFCIHNYGYLEYVVVFYN